MQRCLILLRILLWVCTETGAAAGIGSSAMWFIYYSRGIDGLEPIGISRLPLAQK